MMVVPCWCTPPAPGVQHLSRSVHDIHSQRATLFCAAHAYRTPPHPSLGPSIPCDAWGTASSAVCVGVGCRASRRQVADLGGISLDFIDANTDVLGWGPECEKEAPPRAVPAAMCAQHVAVVVEHTTSQHDAMLLLCRC